jgi:hypothetical protein
MGFAVSLNNLPDLLLNSMFKQVYLLKIERERV